MLVAVGAAPWVLGLSNPIQDVDPAQYADVARHIAEHGGWLDLRDSFGPFVNKPPLSIWAEAVAIKALGPTSAAARLPALLFALLAVWATFALGRALLDSTRGLLAASLFASSVALQLMITDPKVDLALTAMATLSLWAFVEGRTRPAFLWLGWLFTALAVLSKGPLGLALAGMAIGPEAIRHRWGSTDRGLFWQRITGLKPARGLLIVAAISAPYYWSVYQRDGAAGAGFVLWRQNFGRLIGQSGYRNDTTAGFFLHTALWAFLPFTPLLLAAGVCRARAWWATRRLPPEPRRILTWGFVLPFAVFSLSDYKLPQYIFCLAPLGALICAEALTGWTDAAVRRARLGLLAIGLGTAGVVGWLVLDCFPAPGGWAWIPVAIAVPVAAHLLGARLPPPWAVAAAAVASTAVFHLAFAGQIFPRLVSLQAGAALAARARAEDPQGKVLPYLGVDPTFAVSYYGGVPAVPMGLDEVKARALRIAVVNHGAWPDFAGAGLTAEVAASFSDYPTSRPKLNFLREATRPSVLQTLDLVRIRAQ